MYKKDKRRLSVALDPALDDLIENYSADLGISKNKFIDSVLKDWAKVQYINLTMEKRKNEKK